MQTIKKVSAFLLSTWVLLLIVAAGALGLFESLRQEITKDAKVTARGAFWEAIDADGSVLEVVRARGFLLHSGVTVSLTDEDDTRQYNTLALDWDRQEAGSFLKLTFCEDERGAYTLMLGPEAKGGVVVARRDAEGKVQVLGQSESGNLIEGTHKKIRLMLRLGETDLEVEVNGTVAFHSNTFQHTRGAFTIEAPKSPCRIYRMGATGQMKEPGGELETVSMVEDFSRLPRVSYWSEMRLILAQIGIGILGMLFYLRALCLGTPALLRLIRAGVVFLMPMSLYFLWGLFRPLPELFLVAVLLSPVGLVFALFSLRHHLRTESPVSAWGGLRALLASLVVLCLVAWAVGSYQVRFFTASITAENAAQKRPAPESHTMEGIQLLGPHNAVVVDKKFRNVNLSAGISLGKDTVLQIRLRAGAVGKAQGVSLFLSTDPEFRTSFYRETFNEFTPIGEDFPEIAANVPFTLNLQARGRNFEAVIETAIKNITVATATERLFPEGGVVILTARGHASIEDISIEPVEEEEEPVTLKHDLIAGVAEPVLFLLLMTLLFRFFLKIPFLKLLEAGAFALLPLACCFYHLSPSGALNVTLVGGTLLLSFLLFLLVPTIHSKRLTAVRYALLVAVILSGTVWCVTVCAERKWPAKFDSLSRLSLADWSSDHLSRDLVHMQIPALRRWNHYLAKHELRGRSYMLRKPRGMKRILALGTSSTFGYRVKKPYAFRLEEHLQKEGFNVEVMIGAYQGASGTRVFQFFKNVLLDFSPDIVMLSLFFNDSYALTQHDESAYLDRVTHPYYRRSYMDDLIDQVGMWVNGMRMRNMMRDFVLSKESLNLSTGPDSPPARFKKLLVGYAELSEEEGVRLVLIKEPLAGGKDSLWKDEFYAIIDEVAEEYNLNVVDPSPVLVARGGAELFRDVVHPYDEGDVFIARMLLPVLRGMLKEGDRKK